jgi:NAD+ synthase (glutamine-hydrolysing)
LDASLEAFQSLLEKSKELPLLGVVGMPLQVEQRLFNCGVVFSRGKILGVVPKSYLPNYREFYEQRHFSSAETAYQQEIDLLSQKRIPFGSRLIFQHEEQRLFRFHIEICEDLWVPIPPSSYAALAGAHILLNLSASNITIGKAAYRHQLAGNQSARCLAAYLYSAAGTGESTTDLAWDGHAMIYEEGQLLAESERFSSHPSLITADIDLERLSQERMRQTSFASSITHHKDELLRYRQISFSLPLPQDERLPLQRIYERFPYVPSQSKARDERAYEAYQIQVQGLVKRLQATQIQRVVIGVSGGLDSTQALLVCAKAMDQLNLPRRNILAYTMPGFATSQRTLKQAHALMQAIDCTAEEIDIRPTCLQMLRDIKHPYSDGMPLYDITFENIQAGQRTSHLFRLANHHNALVVGTGDLSELALGWCTYGVGDHMSHYNVNASVPKTLIQYLIRWVAHHSDLTKTQDELRSILLRIVDTEISPELIPSQEEGDTAQGQSDVTQKTEDVIGPYSLQDFHLYYILRFGFRVPKIAFLAYHAWHDPEYGHWPDIPNIPKPSYSLPQIKKNLRIFLYRFFQISQFKRSCIPNAPKVGSGGSLSPRGDYRAPSDGEAEAWLSQLDLIPDVLDERQE